MQSSSVPVAVEPQCDRRIDCTTGELGEEVMVVAIHQRDSNHRSQNQEEKPQT
jgi:hypothetical protein